MRVIIAFKPAGSAFFRLFASAFFGFYTAQSFLVAPCLFLSAQSFFFLAPRSPVTAVFARFVVILVVIPARAVFA